MADLDNLFPSRIDGAVRKFNASNEQRIVAETNFFAELDNDFKLLQEYRAYKPPIFKDLVFTTISENKVSALYKGKPFEIEFKVSEDGNKVYEINFHDGSQISYVKFPKSGKMEINGEEFEMPSGTIVETKSVKGRLFSKLIQTPDMQRNVINIPEGLDKAEQALSTYNPQSSSEHLTLPTPEYLLNLLGKASSARILLDLSKNTSIKPSETLHDKINYLEKSIEVGKLPKNISITGVKEDGGKILTIPKENCKYEICGSEMRVIDNSGETKMIARYETKRGSQGLWVVLYNNGKPIKGSHYTPWNLDEPASAVIYTYNNDNTVTAVTKDACGNSNTVKQVLPEGFCLDIDNGFKFVSSKESHLGLIFENQTPFTAPEK